MVAVVVLDEEGRCNYLNAVAEVLTGYGSVEAFGRRAAEVIPLPDGADFGDTALGRAIDEQAEAAGEMTILDAGGRPLPVAFRAVPLRRANGHAHGAVIELIDLSGETGSGRALREREERLRLAVAATGIGIWDVHPATGHRRWSDEFLDILGLPPGTEADPAVFASLIHPEDRERVLAEYERAYTSPEDGEYDAEFRIVRAGDGAERWVVTSGRVAFDADGRPVRAVGTLNDTTERKQAEEQRELLLHELTHRVKNILALVQAVVSQTLRSITDPTDAYERILARLSAMAGAHDLLVASRWVGTPLKDLLSVALEPFAGEGEDRIHLAGEPVEIGAKAVLTVGMVAHELATNAAKYGSLSVPEGRLDVAWRVTTEDGEQRLAIDWRESGGPPVTAPERRGFGSKLIERSVEGNLSGSAELDFAPDGLRCRLAFPLAAAVGPAATSQDEGSRVRR